MEVLNMLTVTLYRKGFFMNKKLIFSILLISLFVFVTVMAFSQTSPSTRWEYFILDVRNNVSNTRLNELGAEGWELVTSSAANNNTMVSTLYFKRRLP